MTTITSYLPLDDAPTSPAFDPVAVDPAQSEPARRSRRRTGAALLAAGAAAVGFGGGWAFASASTHATMQPHPVQAAASAEAPSLRWACDLGLGSGGVSGLQSAVDACLAHPGISVPDARTSPFSMFAAIALPSP